MSKPVMVCVDLRVIVGAAVRAAVDGTVPEDVAVQVEDVAQMMSKWFSSIVGAALTVAGPRWKEHEIYRVSYITS